MMSIKAAARASILAFMMIAAVLAEPGESKLRENPLSALVRTRVQLGVCVRLFSSGLWGLCTTTDPTFGSYLCTVNMLVSSVTCTNARGSLEADFLAAVPMV